MAAEEAEAIREYYDAMGLSGTHADITKLLRRYSFEEICSAAAVKYGKDPRAVLSAFGCAEPGSGGRFTRAEVVRSSGGGVFSMRDADDPAAAVMLFGRKTGVNTTRIFLQPVSEDAATKYHSSYCGKVVSSLSGSVSELVDSRSAAAEQTKVAKVTFRRPEAVGGPRRVLVSLASAKTLSLGSRLPSYCRKEGLHSLAFRDLPVLAVASSKNLVLAGDGGTSSGVAPFELCKVGENLFSVRYESPLSAFEAFGLALSSIKR